MPSDDTEQHATFQILIWTTSLQLTDEYAAKWNISQLNFCAYMRFSF